MQYGSSIVNTRENLMVFVFLLYGLVFLNKQCLLDFFLPSIFNSSNLFKHLGHVTWGFGTVNFLLLQSGNFHC